MLKINDIVDGKYEILRLIGKGGMSKVFLARDSHLNKQWAIKELSKSKSYQQAILEANLIKKLDHPLFVRIVDILEYEDSICIIMDYVEGKSLDFVLQEYGIPSQETVIEWSKQLCKALSYLHHQSPPIIYRDMKPSNIMLQPSGSLKIIDFGIAREYKFENNQDTIALGTRGYAAPEQYQNDFMQSDERTDIYCLGVTIHHLVTGMSPNENYELLPIRTINPNLSSGLENIIKKCTQNNPKDRFSSCEELLYALEHYEQEDDAYKKKMRRRWNLVVCTSILSVFFFVCSILSFYLDIQSLHSNYSYYMSLAYTHPSSQKQYLLKAIEILPTEQEAYLKLIDIYKEDQRDFSDEFLSKVSPYLEIYKDKKPKEYGTLCFEIGKLYWYYFHQQQISLYWFNECSLYCKENSIQRTCDAYLFIGSFYQEVLKMRNEGTSTKEMYLQYFMTMKSLFEQSSTQEDMIRLQLNTILVNSLEGYIQDFSLCVSKDEILSLYDAIIQQTRSIHADTDKTKEIQDEILSRNKERRKRIVLCEN